MNDPAEFLMNLLRAIWYVTGNRQPPTWAKIEKVQARLVTTNRDAVDAAIRLAAKKGWLRPDGDPPSAITLTVLGLKATEAAASRHSTRTHE